MSQLVVTIGESLERTSQRVLENVRRVEAGLEPVETHHLGFPDGESLLEALTVNRLAVLRYVVDHGAPSIRAIALRLDRGYRQVHNDVHALIARGLLHRRTDGSYGFSSGILDDAWEDHLEPR